jgi:RHS repeat-associated protein
VQSEFDFDAAGGRARQVKERIAPNDSREIETTLYLGAYERENHTTKANELASPVLVKTVHRHSLGGGMIYTRTFGGSEPGTKLTNVLKDHLGSTDALVVGIWNGSTFANQSIERLSFDAWGERRDASTQISYRASDSDPFRTSAKDHDRGYTGHEQLDDSGLIHMNGRIYDPELGRFLSPDPVVQIPEYSQNFNRYSYVLNNPLNATDPSGFSFISKAFSKIGSFIKENWRTIVTVVVGVVLVATGIGASIFWGLHGLTGAGLVGMHASVVYAGIGAVTGTIMGGLNAALAGGDLGDVLRGAVVGGINGAITGGVLNGLESSATTFGDGLVLAAGHGILGGSTNVAMGGKFQDGFLSSAISAGATMGSLGWMNKIPGVGIGERAIVRSVIGGTTSQIGGGKFANGAFSSAFQSILTDLPRTQLRGKWVFPEGANINSVKRIYTNGILGVDDALYLAKNSGAAVYFNPSNGFLADVIESTYQKFFGFFGDPLTAGFAAGLRNRTNPIYITAHSQGTVTVTNAIAYYDSVPQGSRLDLDSPAISGIRAHLEVNSIGGNLNYNQKWGDAANLWAISLNPLKFASGLLDFPVGFSIHVNNNTFEKAYGR